jgi:mycothiol synthase
MIETQQIETVTLAGQPFRFRRIDVEQDVPRLVRLINEIEAHDRVDEGTTEEDQREGLGWPEGDPARDRWIVEDPADPDRLIAYGVVWKASNTERANMHVGVHPDWRRRGLGSELLERAVARAREKDAAFYVSGTDDRQPAGAAFLTHHGFAPQAQWVLMHCPAATELAAPQWPPGYTVRPYSEMDDIPLLNRTLNRGFIGHFQHREGSDAEMAHWLKGPHVNPAGIFVAFGPDGDPAGVCWTDISPTRHEQRGAPVGYIDALGVVPEHRRKGIGRALLLHAMRWLRDQGETDIELDAWGHNDLALPLYEGAGFRIAQQGTSFRRDP